MKRFLLSIFVIFMTFVSALADTPDYLCFKAEEQTDIAFTCSSTALYPPNLQYSTDQSTWTDYTLGSSVTLQSAGDKVYFRAKSTNKSFSGVTFSSTGKVAASGNIMSLLDVSCEMDELPELAFVSLFGGCTTLTAAPELPATTLAYRCYDSMFKGCTSLKKTPVLPATKMENMCYSSMFDGCTSLTAMSELPSTELANKCYQYMFQSCTALTKVTKLPATRLETNCYYGMFSGCTSLTTTPEICATLLKEKSCFFMFSGCSKLSKVVVDFTTWNSNDESTYRWLQGVSSTGYFVYNSGLDTSVHGLDAIPYDWEAVQPDYLCFTAAEATDIAFKLAGTNSNLPALRYSTDKSSWDDYTIGSTVNMRGEGSKVYFRVCGNPDNFSIYGGCISFSSTGKVAASGNVMSLLDATCSQKEVPEYAFMNLFSGCSTLTSSPSLPATKLSLGSYSHMFYNCSSLAEAPELPATELGESCYLWMFGNCTSLTIAPYLPATDLPKQCYGSMFSGCSNLSYVKVAFTQWKKIDIDEMSSEYVTSEWLNKVASSGTFICPETLDCTTRSASRVPENWTVNPEFLCFKNVDDSGISVTFTVKGSLSTKPALQYSSDRYTWTDYTLGNAITIAKEDSVFFRAKGTNSTFSESMGEYINFTSTGKVAAGGNIMSLLDASLQQITVPAFAFFDLFSGCKNLTTAPSLPATTLDESCYEEMFDDCTSLTVAPELPALTMAESCYRAMFGGCTALTSVPSLPSTTLAPRCYDHMFYECTSLTEAQEELPALTMEEQCYDEMFESCEKLAKAPKLPATTLAEDCYYQMFSDCKALTAAPALPATTLECECYLGMFENCESLTAAPDLMASTLVSGCYYAMFQGCSSLNEIKVNFTDWNSNEQTTDNWLSGVASIGLFYCPDGLDTSDRNGSKVPADWLVNLEELPSVTLNSAGYATYSAAVNIHIKTEGVAAYIPLVSGNTIELEKIEGDIISSQGVMLYGTPGTTVEFEKSTKEVIANQLSDLNPTTTESTPLVNKSAVEGTVWVLGNGNHFLQYTGSSFLPNRGYLVHDVPAGKKITIVFADETGIDSVKGEDVNAENEGCYNLAGQSVGRNYHGIVIKQGKKLFTK